MRLACNTRFRFCIPTMPLCIGASTWNSVSFPHCAGIQFFAEPRHSLHAGTAFGKLEELNVPGGIEILRGAHQRGRGSLPGKNTVRYCKQCCSPHLAEKFGSDG